MSQIINANATPKLLPEPLITLGHSFELFNYSSMNIDAYMESDFAYTLNGDTIVQKAINWANEPVKIGVSMPPGDWSFFLNNSPMIFLDFYSSNKRERKKEIRTDNKEQYFKHPPNIGERGAEPLNRERTNFSGGYNPSKQHPTRPLITEYNFYQTQPYTDQIISIDPHHLYKEPKVTPFTDFSVLPQPEGSMNGMLKFSKGGSMKQPFVCYFACIDPKDERSVLRGTYSKVMYIQPKLGNFRDGRFYFDYMVKFGY